MAEAEAVEVAVVEGAAVKFCIHKQECLGTWIFPKASGQRRYAGGWNICCLPTFVRPFKTGMHCPSLTQQHYLFKANG